MNIKAQGHSLFQHFQISFFLETVRPIEAKFYVEPPWDGRMIDCSNDLGHMTNMAAMPIYYKNLKNLLLWNQKADDLESWYAALGMRALPIVQMMTLG